MNEVSPQNEREVVQQSTSTDSMPNQTSSGMKKWFREKMEKLGILSPKKESNATEHITLTLEELFSCNNEGFEAGEAAFWEWLTVKTVQEYWGKWVIFTGDGLVASAKNKAAARVKANNKGLEWGDYTIRLVDPDLLKNGDDDVQENENN